ncbi:MAG: hypothetical protein WC254_06705 [Candidatus Woesearchaeota archaeon]|jgi:hypothetical protein
MKRLSQQMYELGVHAYTANNECQNIERFLPMVVTRLSQLKVHDHQLTQLMNQMISEATIAVQETKKGMDKAVALKAKLEEVEQL